MQRTKVNVILPESSETPFYKEVRRTILQCLAKGEWKPGEKISTEPELAERFGVSIPTVRAGVSELVAAHVLVRRQGKGTFVAQRDKLTQRYRYSNVYNTANGNVSPTRHVIAMKKVRANHENAEKLALDVRRPSFVYQISAILRIAGKPVALMDLILPLPSFKGLHKKDIEQTRNNLYSLYQRICNVTVLRMEEQVFARTADYRVSKLLKVPPNHPTLIVERVGFTYNDVPIEIRKRTFEGFEFHYLFAQNRLA